MRLDLGLTMDRWGKNLCRSPCFFLTISRDDENVEQSTEGEAIPGSHKGKAKEYKSPTCEVEFD